jgi:hypothetical protein
MADSSDDALMQSVARNEESALRLLMQRHESWVFSLLSRNPKQTQNPKLHTEKRQNR